MERESLHLFSQYDPSERHLIEGSCCLTGMGLIEIGACEIDPKSYYQQKLRDHYLERGSRYWTPSRQFMNTVRPHPDTLFVGTHI